MTKTSKLAWRILRREWRSGDIRIVVLALIVAVAGLVSVTAFSDRINRAFEQQGSALIAADLVVRLPNVPDAAFLDEARAQGLQHTLTTNFRSVVIQGDRTLLSELKAVEEGYPLRGELIVSIAGGKDQTVGQPPRSGTVWVDQPFLARLGASVGDSIQLGYTEFVIDGIIKFEPDRAGAAFSIAPRVMLNQADISDTGLVTEGSRINYRWLIAGEQEKVDQFRAWLIEKGINEGELQDVSNARPRFRVALERGTRFLSLATLVSLLLSGIAISRSTQYYARRHWDHVAVMRCLGATQTEISRIFLFQLLILSVVGGLVGSALGYLAQQVFVWILPTLIEVNQLPLPSLQPLLMGLALSLVSVVGFGFPAISRLRNVPAMRVIRRELDAARPAVWMIYGVTVLALIGIVFWIAREVGLSLWIIGGTAATLVVLASAALGLIKLISRWRRGLGVAWRFGIGNLARRRASTIGQMVALGIGVMGLLLLTVVRSELFQAWDDRLPADTPNHFLINIQNEQVSELDEFLSQQGAGVSRLTPLVRARLVAINQKPVSPQDFESGFARRMVERAANLSWLKDLPDDNKLISGRWWNETEHGQGLVSVERDYAEALDLQLNDVLTYQVADQTFDIRVVNLRDVSWDSFRPNFFLIVPPKLLDKFPLSYITSFYLPAEKGEVIARLIERFPNVTDIDVDAVLQQVRRLIERVNWSLEFIFVFALLAGLLVLYAAVQTSRFERRQELAVLRALGAQTRQLNLGLIAEFGILGLLAGLLGAMAAGLIGYGLSEYLLNLPYRWNHMIWIIGLFGGGIGIALIGYLASRPDLKATTWYSLRQSE